MINKEYLEGAAVRKFAHGYAWHVGCPPDLGRQIADEYLEKNGNSESTKEEVREFVDETVKELDSEMRQQIKARAGLQEKFKGVEIVYIQ